MTHASVDTWDVRASFPQAGFIDRRGVIAPYDAPLISRRQTLSSIGPTGKAVVRSFELTLDHLTPEEYADLIALVDNSRMGCEPVDLTLRGFEMAGGTSETIQVRIVNSSIMAKASDPVRFSVRVQLEEFIHAP